MLSVLSTYTITIEKDGVDVEIPLCQGIKYSILKLGQSDEKKIYPKEISVKDLFKGYEIKKIKLPVINEYEKGQKFDKLPVLNNLNRFSKYMNTKYKDGEWDIEKEKEKMDEFGVESVRFIYMGLLIENIFHCSIYVPGKILKNGFFYVNKVDESKLKVEEIKLWLKIIPL